MTKHYECEVRSSKGSPYPGTMEPLGTNLFLARLKRAFRWPALYKGPILVSETPDDPFSWRKLNGQELTPK